MHILHNISRSKDNQTVKFGQLTQQNKKNFFLQKSCTKWDRETSSSLVSIYFDNLKFAHNKNKLYKTWNYCSEDMLKFYFFENVLEIVPPPHLMHHFCRKIFLMFYLLTDQISLSDCLYFMTLWAICVLQMFVSQTVTS